MPNRFVHILLLSTLVFLILGLSDISEPKIQSNPNLPIGAVAETAKQDSDSANTKQPTNQNIDTKNINSIPAIQSEYKNRIGKLVEAPTGEKITLHKYYYSQAANDPYSNQWWYATANIASAWGLPIPQKQTLLAIIDTGFALNHEEFNGRLFTNNSETGTTTQQGSSKKNCTDLGLSLNASCNNIDDNVDGVLDNESGVTTYENPSLLNCTDKGLALDKSCNRIDDDSNGYVDDVNGWDFVNQDPSAQAGQLNSLGGGTKHGSMVMGIAAANSNNGVGLAGVDQSSKLLPLQAIDDDNYGDSLTVGNAIRYAANMGADVINLSLGTSSPDSYILDATEYAYSKGAVVVAAAGNDGCDCMVYPARYDITLSVGASNQLGARASFSSYGANLDIMAPGYQITSVTYNDTNATSAYATGSGTSYATPIISGLISVLKGQSPSANQAQLIAALTENSLQNSAGTYYKTIEKGYGDVAVNNAVTRIINPKSLEQAYILDGVANGGIFKYSNNPAQVYVCESGAVGTTVISRATKTNSFLSYNPIDTRLAITNGYAVQPFINACVLQNNDTINKKRLINTNLEFYGLPIKSTILPN